jgi:hypothetical protein
MHVVMEPWLVLLKVCKLFTLIHARKQIKMIV